MDEVLLVTESARRVLHPLNLGVDQLAGRIGDPVAQVGEDVFEPPLQHPCYRDHRLEADVFLAASTLLAFSPRRLKLKTSSRHHDST